MRHHNQPKVAKAGKKQPAVSFEVQRKIDHLTTMVMMLIKRLAKYEPDAVDLLDQIQIQTQSYPDDRVDDLYTDDDKAA